LAGRGFSLASADLAHTREISGEYGKSSGYITESDCNQLITDSSACGPDIVTGIYGLL